MESSVAGAADRLLGRVDARTLSVESRINQVASDLFDQASQGVSRVVESVQSVERDLASQAQRQLESLERSVQQASASVVSQVSGAIDSVLGGLDDAFLAGSRAVEKAIADVSTTVADAIPQWPDLLEMLLQWGHLVWPSWVEPLKALVGEPLKALMHALEQESGEGLAGLLDRIARTPGVAPELRSIVGAARDKQHPFWLLVLPIVAGLTVVPAAATMLAGTLERLRQGAYSGDPIWLPSPEAVAAAVRLRAASPNERDTAAAAQGLTERWSRMFAALQEQLLPPEQLLQLLNRRDLGEDAVRLELSRHGYNDQSIKGLLKLRFPVPPVQDVIRFLVRDVFNEDAVKRGKLDTGFEQNYRADLFDAAGISEKQALNYWRAHWQLPSPTQLFQMVRRSTDASDDPQADTFTSGGESWQNVVGAETVREVLKQDDHAPAFIDRFLAISYTPLTRVDVRRMYRKGILNRAGVVRASMDEGYSKENAERLADFIVADARKEERDESAVFRAPIRDRIARAYLDGTITEQTAKAHLGAVGYDDAETATFFAEAEVTFQAEIADAVRDGARRLYVAGHWSKEQATERLARAGIGPVAINRLFVRWDLEKELRDVTDAERQQRDLTKGEVLAAYEAGDIRPDVAAGMVGRLGYDDAETRVLLAASDRKLAKQQRDLEVARIRVSYLDGKLDRGEASAQLDRMGVTPQARQSYLARWDVEREKALPDLSTTQVRDLVQSGVWDEQRGRNYLLTRGWLPADVDALFRLWRIKAEAKAKAAASKSAPRRKATG